VKLIGRTEIMRFATKHGMPHPTLMRFVLKLLANLTEPRAGTPWTGDQRDDQGGSGGLRSHGTTRRITPVP
jgi:hypothetical protein